MAWGSGNPGDLSFARGGGEGGDRRASDGRVSGPSPGSSFALATLSRSICGRVALIANLSRLRLDQLDQMIDDALVLQPMMRLAGDVDHVRTMAATGETDIGLTRLTRPVDDAADHRNRERGGDMRQPLLQYLDGADDVELLARTRRARNHGHAATAQAQRL